MARLSSAVQRFVIGQLARFHTPTEVQEQVRELFGLEVTRPQLGHYDPTTSQGQKLSKKWRTLFFEERARHKREFEEEIPGANRFYRMRRLQELIDDPKLSRNPKFVRDTIVEMEKIMGDVYTNTRKLQGDPINVLAYLLGIDPTEIPEPEEG